jgi:hypothetical protein
MSISIAARKSKGRNLQKYVVAKLLHYANRYRREDLQLKPDDITSRSMGAQGEDILISPAARLLYGFSVECKSHARYAIYNDYEQAKTNAGEYEPILVIKQNNSKPLIIMDLDYFLQEYTK